MITRRARSGTALTDAGPHDQAEQPQDDDVQQDPVVDPLLAEDHPQAGEPQASYAETERVHVHQVVQEAGDGMKGEDVEHCRKNETEPVRGLHDVAPLHGGAEGELD